MIDLSNFYNFCFNLCNCFICFIIFWIFCWILVILPFFFWSHSVRPSSSDLILQLHCLVELLYLQNYICYFFTLSLQLTAVFRLRVIVKEICYKYTLVYFTISSIFLGVDKLVYVLEVSYTMSYLTYVWKIK